MVIKIRRPAATAYACYHELVFLLTPKMKPIRRLALLLRICIKSYQSIVISSAEGGDTMMAERRKKILLSSNFIIDTGEIIAL